MTLKAKIDDASEHLQEMLRARTHGEMVSHLLCAKRLIDAAVRDVAGPAESGREAPADCPDCERFRALGTGPSHNGRPGCRCGSIASGGTKAHCSCSTCW